ncbi:MAG: hypothetical protein J6W64_04045 [Bacilli bacterium]|nr:hypothetical protein [Bacilli bacterium]
MRELESGARKFNAGAASDDKLIFNRKVCISYKLPYALSVVETEMLKRGLISSHTSLSATGSTSATSTSKSAPSGSSTNSSSIDYSKISLVNSAAYSKV